MRAFLLISLFLGHLLAAVAAPLPIDPLWQSDSFRKAVTGSFGIDSRIEPLVTTEEQEVLKEAADKMAAGQRREAIATLSGSPLLERSPAMLFNLATLHYEEGNKEAALTHFTKALAAFPNFRDAHRNLAVLHVQEGKIAEAESHLARALELGANDGLTYGLLGYCHASRDHQQAALDAYRAAMLTQPKERQWRLGAAQALAALDRPREAASLLQGLIEEQPEDAGAWLAQADAWIRLDDKRRAATNLEIAHRCGSLDAGTLLTLGHLYAQIDLPELALTRYHEALTAPEPASPQRVVEALEIFLAASDWTRAAQFAQWLDEIETYRQAFHPESGEKVLVARLTRARAILELETGDHAAGAKRVAEWLNREPLDGHALLLLARFREEAGDTAEAEMLLEQAARLPEHAAAAHLARGRLLVAARDYEAALEQLRKSQELKPSDSLAEYIEAIREFVETPAP